VEAGEFFHHRHKVLGLPAPPYPDEQAEAAVLVDHLQELEPPPIAGGVELKVDPPHIVRIISLVSPHRAVGKPCTLLLPRSGPLLPFLAPKPVHPLVVHHPRAIPPQQAVGHAPSPADVLGCDFVEASPQPVLRDVDDTTTMSLGAAVMAHHPAGEALSNPEQCSQGLKRPAALLRAQRFTTANNLSVTFISSDSARGFLRRELSLNSWLSHMGLSACMQP